MRKIGMLLAVAAVLGLGCGKLSQLDQAVLDTVKGKKVEERAKETPSEPEAAPVVVAPRNPVESPAKEAVGGDTDRDLKEELNGYVECINRSQSRAQDSYNR